jgi:hypothetical protein
MSEAEDPGVVLSMLYITGDADTTFPECVVTEIADSHGIDFNPSFLKRDEYYYSLIQKINETGVEKVRKVGGTYSPASYSAIARFVNKNYSWTPRTLMPAFNFILTFRNRKDFNDIREDIPFGLPTPEQPISISACLAFAICKSKGIFNIDQRTTKSMLNFAAKLCLLSPVKFRSEFVTHALSIFSPSELISSVIQPKEKPKK